MGCCKKNYNHIIIIQLWEDMQVTSPKCKTITNLSLRRAYDTHLALQLIRRKHTGYNTDHVQEER